MNMKWIKRFFYAVCSPIALALTACSQTEDMNLSLVGREINASFLVGSVQTRVNTLDKGDKWENGDQIQVEVSTDTKVATTGLVTYDGEKQMWSNNSSFRWLDSSERHKIVASTSLQEGYGNFTLSDDQSTLQNLKKADLVNGVYIGGPERVISIQMQHRMSMVTITYNIGTADYPGKDMSEPEVYSKSLKANFALDQEKGELAKLSPSGNPVWVKAYMHDNKFSAIVVPGSYAAGEVFVKFKIGDDSFNVKMRMSTEFEEGHLYTYELKVGKDKVELTQISVDDLAGWTNEEELK